MPAFNADAVTDRNIADIAAYLATLPPAVAHQPQRRAQATGVTGTATSPSRSTIASASSATATSSAVGAPLIPTDPNRGRQIYAANCAACHGADARGGIGPTLRGEKSRKDTAAAIVWIKNPLPPMPKLYPSVLSEKDVEDVAAYVESL
jgi:mono/diheme cytochrome c family protein